MKPEIKKYTIEKLRKIRLEKNLSMSTLGCMIGRDEEYIACFELGLQKFGILNVLRFCEALNINPVDFYADLH